MAPTGSTPHAANVLIMAMRDDIEGCRSYKLSARPPALAPMSSISVGLIILFQITSSSFV